MTVRLICSWSSRFDQSGCGWRTSDCPAVSGTEPLGQVVVWSTCGLCSLPTDPIRFLSMAFWDQVNTPDFSSWCWNLSKAVYVEPTVVLLEKAAIGLQNNTHMNARMQDSPSEHLIITSWAATLLILPANDFNFRLMIFTLFPLCFNTLLYSMSIVAKSLTCSPYQWA